TRVSARVRPAAAPGPPRVASPPNTVRAGAGPRGPLRHISARVVAGREQMIGAMGEPILLRHGETEWSRAGRHTGSTDVPLTAAGEAAAAALAPVLARRDVRAAFTSPLQRAARTAALA